MDYLNNSRGGEMAVVYTLSGTEGTELPDVITVNTVFVLSAHRFV